MDCIIDSNTYGSHKVLMKLDITDVISINVFLVNAD